MPRVLLFADPQGFARRRRGELGAAAFHRPAGDYPVRGGVAGRRADSLADTTLFVDALLGTGLTKPLDGFLLEVVRDINTRFPAARVLAVDLPTGISADSGELIGEHMRADFSVTFTAPKIAHVFPPACEHVGEWVVKQIGTPREALESDPSLS